MSKQDKYLYNNYLLSGSEVLVLAKVPKTRTKLIVQHVDRGPGWDERTKTYKGVRFKGGWSRGQNYRYGEKSIIHYKELEE